MYVVSVGSVLKEAKHDGIANGISETQGQIVGARESLTGGKIWHEEK